MRVTAAKKEETRRRIIECALKLFNDKGFEETTTRDIAEAAGIAAGTMFNYFPTKEALAMTIICEAMDGAKTEFEGRLRGDEALDEALFAHVAVGLRHLTPHRSYVGEVLETALSPFSRDAVCEQAQQLRVNHLETVGGVLTGAGAFSSSMPVTMTMHLYWTLYLGVLSFWAADESPNREDTLVVLDQSMRLFVESLSAGSKDAREVNDGVNVTQDR
ncbi:MAG: TetR/AcrR family transcriptional regulator [Phycisphaerales bacterium]|nr:MAG: TetR/AcrR family transcriptional regulator [Phycisphaerales bacterium]